MAKKKQVPLGDAQAILGNAPPEPRLDQFLVSRFILGALSGLEQRWLLVRLLRLDPALREEITPFLAPLVDKQAAEPLELSQLETALASGGDAQAERQALLGQESEDELEELIREYTFEDLFHLGEATRRFFSWSMAERLLHRAHRPDLGPPLRSTTFFLAAMVIDGLDILTAAGVLPPYPRTIADLRRRLHETGRVLQAEKNIPSPLVEN